jgi:outer membrane lipoprotein-sorting protein
VALGPLCPARSAAPGAEQVLARAEERFRSLTDYQCVAEVSARAGSKTESGSCRLWFKSPRMLRIHVLRGKERGSQVAVDEEGTLRGRKGGLLKPLVKKLRWTDKRLYSIRGALMTDLVWGSLFAKWRERASIPGARCSMSQPARDACYELSQTYTEGDRRFRVVYRIEPDSWLLTEGRLYEDDVEVERVAFRDIRINTGIEDDWFGF